MQNQSKHNITFDTQLKTALLSNLPRKQDLRNFFNRAPFAVKIAKTVNFAVVILMRKAVSIPDILHNYYSSELLVQPLFQHQRENREV